MRIDIVRNWLMAALAVLLGAVVMGVPTEAADPLAGSQGTDTSLALTDSAVTVSGRGAFADLEITVNQTEKLTNQAISITWEGGTPTIAGAGRFAGNYLQIMQCWGDDDGTIPENPGPPPEQCVQGAVAGTYGGLPGTLYPTGFAITRVISRSTWPNFDASVGFLDTNTTNVWRPFRAVDGTVVNSHTDPNFNPAVVGGDFWLNPYFDIVTTNEIAGGVTRANGTGAELMQVLTGVQSTGLGCGQRVLRVDGGEPQVPKCWLVLVPRGNPVDENAGTPFEETADQVGVATSPLSPSAWANRIAIPLDFSPVDTPCRLGDDERQVAGNELVLSAVASWQPALCGERQLPPFSYASVGDQTARRQIVTPAVGSPGLVVVNKPIPAADVDDDNPVLYAPLAASGVAIGFNIERVPKPTSPDGAQQLAGVRVAELNLTPRLVAKLLTQSYLAAVRILEPPPYDWVTANPAHLGIDPDFLQFNAEFALLGNSDRNFSSLTVPAGNTDAAQQVWEWVLGDPEARAWLDGEPDEWGMRVNPAYSTDASINPTGFAFGDPLPPSFPRADAFCHRAAPVGIRNDVVPPPLCGIDWLPYARSFEEAALMTRAAYDSARIVLNPFAVNDSSAWSRSEPQYLGFRTFLSLTDTPSAERYGVQTARLSRAGDNGPDRTFVAPDADGLRAGVDSMKPREIAAVREPAVGEQAVGSYPLTNISYAAVAPLSLDAEARADYSEFVRYVVTDGQSPGADLGDLPVGYLPLPTPLVEQALATADAIVQLQPAPDPVSPVVPPTPVVTSPPRTVSSNPANSTRTSSQRTGQTVTAPPPSAPIDTTVPEPVPETTGDTTPPSTEAEDPPAAVATPAESTGPVRYAVPVVSGMALLSALGALELTKRPRRIPAPPQSPPEELQP